MLTPSVALGLLPSLAIGLLLAMVANVSAQPPMDPIDAAEIESIVAAPPDGAAVPAETPSGIDLLTLMTRGGGFMIPIGVMSFLVVALAVERILSLRTGRIVPRRLERDLYRLTDSGEALDVEAAYQLCEEDDSPTSRVIRAMLRRTGQPLADVERAGQETIEREADQYASPIRWLTLAAAATPLMGLLGTVWGMIVAFHESTLLTPDRSRSEQLSEGIYTALVTTLAGLIVAIPAAILALYLENRIAKLFHRIERLTFDIASGVAGYAGRQRIDSDGALQPIEGPLAPLTDVPKPASPPSKKKRGGAKAG